MAALDGFLKDLQLEKAESLHLISDNARSNGNLTSHSAHGIRSKSSRWTCQNKLKRAHGSSTPSMPRKSLSEILLRQHQSHHHPPKIPSRSSTQNCRWSALPTTTTSTTKSSSPFDAMLAIDAPMKKPQRSETDKKLLFQDTLELCASLCDSERKCL